MSENMNGLAKKFLQSIQDWIDRRIPEKTKDCLRTKIAIITKIDNGTYNVVLASDYGTYVNYKDLYDNGEITLEEFTKQTEMLTLDGLITIKSDSYKVGDYVIIGIVDNKLTNAFIIYRSIQKGV